MRTTLLTLALLAATTVARAGDLDKLQGRWECRGGPKRDVSVSLEFKGETATLTLGTAAGLKIKAKGRLVLDESTSPKTLDWVGFKGLDGQEVPEILGIYDLDGESLKLCNGGFSGGRPAEFKPGEGPLAEVVVMGRPAEAREQPVASIAPAR